MGFVEVIGLILIHVITQYDSTGLALCTGVCDKH